MIMAKKGMPFYTEKDTVILLLNLFGTIIISHFLRFVNMLNEFCLITFREVEKSLPLHKGAFLCSSMIRQFS